MRGWEEELGVTLTYIVYQLCKVRCGNIYTAAQVTFIGELQEKNYGLVLWACAHRRLASDSIFYSESREATVKYLE